MLQPIQKPAPLANEATRIKRLGVISPDSPSIFIHEQVLDQIIDYSEKDQRRELGGFLLGGLYRDTRPYIEIRHFLPAVEARSQAGSLTFTHETWSKMNRQVQSRFPDDRVVGWQHTHPGFGVFLSAYDLFIHRHFFNQYWQVAMVVDPRSDEFSFFQWSGDDVVDCGFICVGSLPNHATKISL